MNDDFIYKALPKVPKEFMQALYAKISTGAPGALWRERFALLGGLRWSQAAIIILGVLLLIAWSQIRFWIRYVPVGELWLVEFNQSTQRAQGDQPAVPFVPTPLPTPRIFDPTLMSTAEMEEFLQEFGRLVLYFPSWIPEGFQAVEPPREMISWEDTIGIWSNNAQEKIRLFYAARAGSMRPYAPSGMWKEIRVNGEPAILIYGRLALMKPGEKTRKWDETLGLQLHWGIGKYVYALETYGRYVSEQDLIRMAESAQEFLPWQLTPTP
jgi:hypothetical protein